MAEQQKPAARPFLGLPPPAPLSSTLRRFSAPDGALPRRVRQELTALLEAGQAVALPTETVYGLAVRADESGAVERLRELKGRGQEVPITLHVGDLDVLARVTGLPRTVRRLAERYWPGPLTLVVRADTSGLAGIDREGWLGIRLPAHTPTASFLEELPFPVAMSSANRAGEPPATSADLVETAIPEGVAYLVDGGDTRLREASAVLRVGPGRFELLREGLFSADELRHTAGLRMAFVCTGNTCRSPMAEALARAHLVESLGAAPETFGFEVSSMGVLAGFGAPASEHSVSAMHARGLDLSDHSSRTATLELVSALDRAYGLTSSHVDALRAMLPPKRVAIVELLDPEGEDIPDPIGGSAEEYERCAVRIAEAITRRAHEWI